MAEIGKDTDRSGSPAAPAFPAHGLPQLPGWLQELDLTEDDLPYIQTFLHGCFDDWLDQADGFPWVANPILLVHPDGTLLAAGGGTQADVSPPVDWSEAIIGDNAVAAVLGSCRAALIRAAAHADPAVGAWDSVAVPVFTRSSGILCAVLAALLPCGTAQAGDMKLLQAAALHFKSCLYRRFEYLFIGGLIRDRRQTGREERRRDLLFEILRRLNDHLEVEQVLSEMLTSLEDLYPECEAALFLSQDFRIQNEKVKPLAFHQNEVNLCKQAYLDGETKEQQLNGRHLLAVPLSGKQGVYGILRLELRANEFDEVDMKFINRLAGAAGAAFEKAKLHEQANALVAELRLINELTRRLNSRLNKLQHTLEFASSQLLSIFKADFCWLLQFDAAKNQFVLLTSNVPDMTGHTFDPHQGFIGMMWETKEPIILSDYDAHGTIHSEMMSHTMSKSLLASPLMRNEEMIGAVMVAHRTQNHFTYDNYKLLQVLSVHLGLAVSNASTHAEVRRMVITDNVTGLFSRHYLNERIARQQKREGSGSLILVDLDHFKQINDTYGHQVGDSILHQVSQIIRTSIREGDIAARWGGEELAIYLPLLSLERTENVAERIRQRVEIETYPQVTVSCGVSEWCSDDEQVSVESLFYKADMALYEAKHLGRNRVEIA